MAEELLQYKRRTRKIFLGNFGFECFDVSRQSSFAGGITDAALEKRNDIVQSMDESAWDRVKMKAFNSGQVVSHFLLHTVLALRFSVRYRILSHRKSRSKQRRLLQKTRM